MATIYKMRQLTENSWVLIEDGERTGLVIQRNGDLKIIGSNLDGSYRDINDLKSKVGKDISIEVAVTIPTDAEEGDIDGFPIRHTTWFNIQATPVPSYTRTEKSQNRYAAGYYGLRFPHGWTQSFCPKLSTLSEYEYMGPFTTKLEMSHQISIKNKSINI